MTTTLIILVITVALFIWGRVRADIVALTALAALLVLGILTPAEALAGFSSPIVIMMIGLFEIVVMPTSNFAGLRIGDANLRKRFGINVLGVKRGDEYITENLIATKLHVGDMLLVQGEWTNLAHLATDTSNWVVIDQPEKTADKVLLDYKAPVAAAIMLLMMKAGGYTFMDYVKVGLPLQIIIGVVMTFVLPLLFPY